MSLYVSDSELIARLGLPAREGRTLLVELDKGIPGHPQFPQKQRRFGGRRFWPACEKWFYNFNGIKTGEREASRPVVSELALERWDEPTDKAGRRRGARPDLAAETKPMGRVLAMQERHRAPRIRDQNTPHLAPVGE